MKALVVGSGAREHALAWRLSFSPQVTGLWVAGGNSGTAQVATNVAISPEDVSEVARLAGELECDLVVVGPELPLVNGLTDRLAQTGIPSFGPTASAARLESSKSFARQVMADAGVPGPDFRVFGSQREALDFLQRHGNPVVVKADGLAAGKGVALCAGPEEAALAVRACMEDRLFGAAGDSVVIEEWLQGTEVSVFAFCDGETLSQPVAACDYKQVGDGDQGPNTGGMGSFAPPSFWNRAMAEEVTKAVLEPTVGRMTELGCPYRGMLYAGLMLTPSGPRVLEFNCRFGDPEAQVILPLLESDPVEVMLACVQGNLADTPVIWADEPHVGVVMVSDGYPGAYETGKQIFGLEESGRQPWDADTLVFHAGARRVGQDGQEAGVVTDGGRVLTVVGRGDSLEEARGRAYEGVSGISFEGARFRRDIADLSVGSRGGE